MTTDTIANAEVAALLQAPRRRRRIMLETMLQARPDSGPILARALMDANLQAEQGLDECQAVVGQFKALMDELTVPPSQLGAVIAQDDDHCVVALGSVRQRVKLHPDMKSKPLQIGDVVCVSRDGNILLSHLPGYTPPGRIAPARGWHGKKLLVEQPPDHALALDVSPKVAEAQPREGDRVLFHEEWKIALDVVERAEQTTSSAFEPAEWGDIGGLDDVIDELLMEIDGRFLHPERAAALQMKPLTGVTLEGPPGTGKTLLIRALATWIQKHHQRRVVFQSVPPGSWRDPFYGMSERRLVDPIKQAKRLVAENKADLVIVFYDEIDTLGARSNEQTNRIDSRVLTSFLPELDGLGGRNGVLVFGATNRIDLVDEAILRMGRFGDLILRIPRPGREAARAVLRCHIKPDLQFWTNGRAVEPAVMVERCIEAALGRLFKDGDPQDSLAELVLAGGQRRVVWPKEVLSGAMLANIVQRAKRTALRRGLVGPGGLIPDDLAYAADQELDSITQRFEDPGKAREILGDRTLPIVQVHPRRRVTRPPSKNESRSHAGT